MRIAIKLKPAAERQVKKRHPWVFEGSIVKQSKDGQAGDLVIVFDQKKNKFLALGLYDPYSPIRVKLLQFHQSAQINEDWFFDKIKSAFQIRTPLLETDTNSYRLIFGENDGLPGLVCDVYDKVLVLKIYSMIWFPFLDIIQKQLLEISSTETAVLRLGRNIQEVAGEQGFEDGQILSGTLDNDVVIFREHGLRFSANVIRGHKTGYFLDHRHNRKQVGALAKGKSVLDVFSYAGGFSVHALVGGAKEVVSIDISAKALEVAQQNANLNQHQGKHMTMTVDAFEGMKSLIAQGKRFDLIIIDPPSFAKRSDEVEVAKKHYEELAFLGASLINAGGTLILASCSSRVQTDAFFECCEKGLQRSNRFFQLLERTFHDIDHPIAFPEGAYLKAGYFKVN